MKSQTVKNNNEVCNVDIDASYHFRVLKYTITATAAAATTTTETAPSPPRKTSVLPSAHFLLPTASIVCDKRLP